MMLNQSFRCVESPLDIGRMAESLAWSAACLLFGPDGGQGHIENDTTFLRIAAYVHTAVRAA